MQAEDVSVAGGVAGRGVGCDELSKGAARVVCELFEECLCFSLSEGTHVGDHFCEESGSRICCV